MSAQSRPRASFGTEQRNIPGVLLRSRGMYNGFTANVALLGSPTIPMPAFLALIDALEQAQETTTLTKAKGSALVRDTKRDALWTAMEVLQKCAQSVADTMTATNAAALIVAAGLLVTKIGAYQKPALTAALAATPGSVVLEANRTLFAGAANRGRRVAFNWQWSLDGGKTWTSVTSTPVASTVIPGLTLLCTYSFRVSVTISREPAGPWSQAISVLVH
jgi:hypothetical protein